MTGTTVYVMRAYSGQCKVGITTNPDFRLYSIHRDNVICAPGPIVYEFTMMVDAETAVRMEEHAHALLWNRRIRGEWFDVPRKRAVRAIERARIAVMSGSALPRPSNICTVAALEKSYVIPKRVEMTPEQCLVARLALNWNSADLGARSNVARRRIEAFEIGERRLCNKKARCLQFALEVAGVGFNADGTITHHQKG